MTSERGDVVLVLYPNSDLLTVKRRPALVIQADGLRTGLPQTIVAMISTRVERASHPSRVLVAINSPEGSGSGLRSDSVVMLDNIATVLNQQIERVLGELRGVEAIDAALRRTLAL